MQSTGQAQWASPTPEWSGLQVVPDNTDKVFIPRDEHAPELNREHEGPEVYREYTEKEHGAAPISAVAIRTPVWKRKRVLIPVVIVVIIVIGAILGGIFGSRAAQKTEASGASDDSSPPLTPSISDSDPKTTSAPPPSPTSNPSTESTASSSTSTAKPAPTSIKSRTMLSAASYRNGKTKESTIFLAYQSPNSDFQIVRFTKSDGKDTGEWHEAQSVVSASPPKELSGIGLGVVVLNGQRSTVDDVYLKMTVLSSSDFIIQFSSDASGTLDFGKSGGEEPTRIGSAGSFSNLAMHSNYLVFQTNEGALDFRTQVWIKEDQFAQDLPQYDEGARNGTRFAIVPLSASYETTYEEKALGIFFDKGGYGLSTLVPSSSDFEGPFSKFPKDIMLQRSSSFTAFSVAHSKEKDDDSVDIYVLYQDSSPDFKLVSTTDGGKTWEKSSPKALSGGDIGTSIACTSLATIDEKGSTRLEAASDLTRCYFVKGGFMTEVQFDGEDWKVTGEVPLP